MNAPLCCQLFFPYLWKGNGNTRWRGWQRQYTTSEYDGFCSSFPHLFLESSVCLYSAKVITTKKSTNPWMIIIHFNWGFEMDCSYIMTWQQKPSTLIWVNIDNNSPPFSWTIRFFKVCNRAVFTWWPKHQNQSNYRSNLKCKPCNYHFQPTMNQWNSQSNFLIFTNQWGAKAI